jgi:hypothetical protein
MDGPVTWDEAVPAPPAAVSHHGRELFALYAALLFIAAGLLVEVWCVLDRYVIPHFAPYACGQ